MKVIFIQDLKGVGRKNEIKEQPDGYARNFLIPKKIAVVATPEGIKKVERSLNEVRVEKDIQVDLFKKNLQSIHGVVVTIKAKTNEKGSLFKAIHAKDIALCLKKEHKISIDENFIHLSEPIKSNGEFKIPVEALGIREEISVVVVNDKK